MDIPIYFGCTFAPVNDSMKYMSLSQRRRQPMRPVRRRLHSTFAFRCKTFRFFVPVSVEAGEAGAWPPLVSSVFRASMFCISSSCRALTATTEHI